MNENADVINACSLSAPELAERREAFAALPVVGEAGGRIVYRDEPGVEEALRELVRLEGECCPTLRFELTREDDDLVLTFSA